MPFTLFIKNSLLSLAILIFLSASSYADENEQVRIVGSSTVYPFSTVVAERFGRLTQYKTPIIESTGTGGGFKLFCAGTGGDTIDITNASRAITASERADCARNNVNNIIEVKVGYDGIVLANALGSLDFSITTRDIFLALADTIPGSNGRFEKNTALRWSDVNPELPDLQIEVLGPPPTSGTRDAFIDLAMEQGCKKLPEIAVLEYTQPTLFDTICHTIRDDGAYIEAGENDNLIIQKLGSNDHALGIVGFSFLDRNHDRVKAASINGVKPSFSAIADGSYVISRPLFFYVKGEKVSKVPSLKPFVDSFLANSATGEDGYLAYRGLIPMSAEEHQSYRNSVSNAMTKGGVQ
ncbi:substrate-binding domain-containing protein [Kordiimonas sp. SCSIO 12610]|uniref:substrate-binding domain-containing protein n=1 Tax=Kordiimonas sp. SCSIO 12610 TaxID=2829597 RepID=UPI00351F52EA